MARLNDTQKADLLDKAMEAARWRLGDREAAALEPFVRHYYAGVPGDQIAGEVPETLFGAALAHLRLAGRRRPGTPNIRVYNPHLDEHGWRSGHTVIEICTDDMPFLVDSVTAEINSRNLAVHRIIHPLFSVVRAADGALTAASPPAAAGGEAGAPESFMHIEITRQSGGTLDGIAASLRDVLADVRVAVEDWQAMRTKLAAVVDDLRRVASVEAREEAAEAIAFLEWLTERNFTFLGYRAYRFEPGGATEPAAIRSLPEASLGLLRDPQRLVFDDVANDVPLPPVFGVLLDRPEPMRVTKANCRATVHRPVHMDVLLVKAFDAAGAVDGIHLFAGLFGSPVYHRSARNIPWLRLKVNRVVARAGFAPRSHDGRALTNILETYPRDELFQVDEGTLLTTAISILQLQIIPRVALFVRCDELQRFVACLIYIPRDRYGTELRLKVQSILERAFDGVVSAHYSLLGDSPLARLQVYVRTTPGRIPPFDADDIEARIAAAARTWSDSLKEALEEAHGEEEGRRLFQRYGAAFPPGYRERFSGPEAVADVDAVERTLAAGPLGMALYRPLGAGEQQMRFKLFRPDAAITLSRVLPMLEHLGVRVVDEVPHAVELGDGEPRTVMIHDFGLETRDGTAIDLSVVRELFQETFLRTWLGEVESDRFNGLALGAGLSWRQVVVLRAYCKYLRQAGIPFSQAYMEETLIAHPAVVRDLVTLFEALFRPDWTDDERQARTNLLRERIAARLDEVAGADDDRILRRFLNAVENTLRTNYFQPAVDGAPKPYLAFKLDSQRIDDLPPPRPMVEVFVYAPTMEGIHLRGGKVARGGIRWSDRREDFRTEIFGLMKAQMVKNAVIVPVGAKGGFIVKRPPDAADREAFLAEGVRCYRTLVHGLLDLTDNLTPDGVVPPVAVVRRDGDDPYLVVAADKGTASFSDIANGIALDESFWLGDAFASGGSQGYDHKKMAITARGAWESVKRHFRELGHDTQTQDFTVIGVGDMSGDVFGNGMLLSEHIRLLAAFDHRHVFLDPDPDPKASLAERRRLFDLSRSSWADYDPAVLSPGGVVFDRRAKTVRPSPEVRARFGLETERIEPNALIRALLKADVDLLWFGGIGTFVKASAESDADVGDRTNDAVRVNGADLRCRVIGEGANLGVTQLGRIEFARHGGRINTDFIDNSAGVDCSDHEVNIKILLDKVVADGDLTHKQRNALLVEMTDEVAWLVLRDNYLQTQAISLLESVAEITLEHQARLIRMLEREGRLDRAVEFLPDDEVLAERAAARLGLVRPEIAVLFSYCKIWLYDQVLASDLPDDPHLAVDLLRYFPSALRERFGERIPAHRLKRELIATEITNSLINRVGGTFVTGVAEKTGMPPAEIARAYIIARDVFGVREIWQQIEALDDRPMAAVQTSLHREVQQLLERTTLWFLANGGSPLDISVNVAAFQTVVAALSESIETLLPEAGNAGILARARGYREAGVPDALARRVATLPVMPSACDIVRLSAAHGIPPDTVARLYFRLGELLGFGWLRQQAEALSAGSYWQRLAVAAVVEELYAHQRDVTRNALAGTDHSVDAALTQWCEAHRPSLDRTRSLLAELEAAASIDVSMLAVASRQLRALTVA
jgi:glutamate dehydrogenase